MAGLLCLPAVAQQKSRATTFTTANVPSIQNNLSVPVGEVINFESDPAGTILSSVFGDMGSGPILVRGRNPLLGNTNAAVVFDSSAPTGEDPDLGTPNETFAGPGVGTGGEMGSPFENAIAKGNVLIVAEDLVDADMNGLVDDPDDADVEGASLSFDFASVAPVTLNRITIIDVEVSESPASVEFFDAMNNSLANILLPVVGDNGISEVDFNVPNVQRMTITLNGSGAIDDIDFTPAPPPLGSIGDYVWCDENDDGVQDPGEPGIPGVTVNLVCAGPDGVLGTADDLMDSQVTNASGNYLFTELPAGLCVVTVDETTVGGKVRGMCPNPQQVDLGVGENYLDADFCYVDPPLGSIGDYVWCDENNDGVQDPGEPGIEGALVTLTCAGPDGILGTGDDIVMMMMTDANGNYLFTGLPAGPCNVQVDPTSVPGKVPGVCPISVNVDLGEGENYLDADFCFVEPPSGGAGCTPGYWRQSQHFWAWTAPYTPDTLFSDVFEDAFPGQTLLDVVWIGGGKLNALGRHTVAALLNAASPNVNYNLTVDEVITMFNDVYPGGNYNTVKNVFANFNEQGCGLGNGKGEDTSLQPAKKVKTAKK